MKDKLEAIFDDALSMVVKYSTDNSINIRSKSVKVMHDIAETSPEILTRPFVMNIIRTRLNDQSSLVRDSALDFLYHFMLLNEKVLQQYFFVLSEKSYDAGLNVRKKVIKILQDLYIHITENSMKVFTFTTLLHRLSDTDKGVVELAAKALKELLFYPLDTSSMKKDASVNQIPISTKKIFNENIMYFAKGLYGLESFHEAFFQSIQKKEIYLFDLLIESSFESLSEIKEDHIPLLQMLFEFSGYFCQNWFHHLDFLLEFIQDPKSPENAIIICLKIVNCILTNIKREFEAMDDFEKSLSDLIRRGKENIISAAFETLCTMTEHCSQHYDRIFQLFEQFYHYLSSDVNASRIGNRRALFSLSCLCRFMNLDNCMNHFSTSNQVKIKKFLSSDSSIMNKIFDLFAKYVEIAKNNENLFPAAVHAFTIGYVLGRNSSEKFSQLFNSIFASANDSVKVIVMKALNLFFTRSKPANLCEKDSSFIEVSFEVSDDDIQKTFIVQTFLGKLMKSALTCSKIFLLELMIMIDQAIKEGSFHPQTVIS